MQIITDEQGVRHEFPDEATPEMIAEAMGLGGQTITTNRVPPPAMAANVKRGTAEAGRFTRGGIATGLAQIDPQTGKPNWFQAARDLTDPVYRPLAEGGTLGLGDEARAAGSALGSMMTGGDAGKAYESALEGERAENRKQAEKNPKTNLALKIVGSLGTGMAARGAVLPTTVKQAAITSAKVGGGMGAITGAGSAEGGVENRAIGGAVGGVTGAAIGAALPYALSGIGKIAQWVRGAGTKATAPTTAQLRAGSQAKYAEADSANLVVSQPSVQKLAATLETDLRKAGIDATLHPRATAALKRIQDSPTGNLALQDIDILRQISLDAGRSGDAGEQRIASIITDKIDDFIDNLSPSDVVSGDASLAASSIKEARLLWNRMRKAQAVEDAMYAARQQAERAGSGGNVDNAIRQKISALLLNKQLKKTWTAEERVLMERIVKGTPGQHLARLLGKMSPEGNGLALMLQTGAAMATGGTSAPLMAVGAVAKRVSDKATAGNVQGLIEAVQSGQVTPKLLLSLTPTQRKIVQSILIGASSQIGRTAGEGVSTPQSAPAR